MNIALSLVPSFSAKNHLGLKLKIIQRFFLSLIILTGVFLLIYYVFQVNNEISDRYSVWHLEKILSEVSKENKNLEVNSSQINSLDKITELLNNLNFEKPEKTSYIRVLGNQVVAK